MKIAIFGRSFQEPFFNHIKQLFDKICVPKNEVIVFKPYLSHMLEQHQFVPDISKTFTKPGELDKQVDMIFSIGGDGTFLDAMLFAREKEIPVIGINSGRLGFLANISKEEIPNAIDSILNNNFSTENRSLVEVKANNWDVGPENVALNEIALIKKDVSMIKIHAYLDDNFITSYWADGLIIATPTGSTAYSLSVGGPILMPNVNNFIIAPIAPHHLTIRPIIVPDNCQLKFIVEGRSSEFMLSLDHRQHILSLDTEIIIKKADYSLKMVKLENNSFYNTLRNKLMWGADKRN